MYYRDMDIKRLGDIAKISSGSTPARNNQDFWNGDIPWVSTGELSSGFVNETREHVSLRAVHESSLKLLKPGTLLMAMYGQGKTRGIVARLNITATTNQACASIEIKKDEPRYVYYFLQFRYESIRKLSNGGSQENLSTEIIKKIKIFLPPIAEQRKIAEILSAQDRIIELKTKLLEEKKRLKKYLCQMLLSGKRKIPGHAEPWKRKRLSDIAQRLTVRNTEQCNNVLTISASDGLVSQEAYFKKEVAGKDKSNYFLLLRDDYAYNRSSSSCNPYGAIKRLKKYSTGIVSPLYICFRMNTNLVDVNYVEFAFDSGVLNKELDMVTQEGARNHGLLNIAVEDFFNCRIELPSYDEQVKIAEILQALYYSVTLLEKELEQENLKKKALMQQLLTGKIRVKV